MEKMKKEQWLIWCGLNSEQEEICKQLDSRNIDYVSVYGNLKPDEKEERIIKFQDGKVSVMVTKPEIAGMGLNLQNCHNMIFIGLSDSWEKYYQCIRRSYRFGQKQKVNVYIVLSEIEREIFDNVMQKEHMAIKMSQDLIDHVKQFERSELQGRSSNVHHDYVEKTITKNLYTAMLGDSAQRLKEIPSDSIHLSVYSPPFADLYTYSASEYDLGNSRNWDEFFQHYNFVIRELLRVTMPGRITCVHTADIPAMSQKDGYIGMRDFPGAVIKAYEENGWIYHGYAVVSKNPQAQAIRTHSKGLLFVQFKKDSASSRPAILDRVLFFRKDGDNAIPITPPANGEANNDDWINWAGGIWTDISESDTLQFTTARDANDERHIAPLQLGTIERCVKLYSNPGETVLTPFLGIGSEAYTAIKFGRKAIGIELKQSYFNIAVKNLEKISSEVTQVDLFSGIK